MEHSIDTGDTPPIKQWMRRTPLHLCDEEEAYLKKMLDSKVIQPYNSEWASYESPHMKERWFCPLDN